MMTHFSLFSCLYLTPLIFKKRGHTSGPSTYAYTRSFPRPICTRFVASLHQLLGFDMDGMYFRVPLTKSSIHFLGSSGSSLHDAFCFIVLISSLLSLSSFSCKKSMCKCLCVFFDYYYYCCFWCYYLITPSSSISTIGFFSLWLFS